MLLMWRRLNVKKTGRLRRDLPLLLLLGLLVGDFSSSKGEFRRFSIACVFCVRVSPLARRHACVRARVGGSWCSPVGL